MTYQLPTWVDAILEAGVPAYPKYDSPITEWQPAILDAAFIALHPFWRGDVPVSWGEVATDTGLSIGRLNRGLLTATGALRVECSDPDSAARLNRYCAESALDLPIDGCVPPTWTSAVVGFFGTAGAERLWVRDEFGQITPSCSATAVDLDLLLGRIGRRGAIFSSVSGVLVSVDWDSFFTLFFAPRSLLANLPLEGFLCGIDTKHFWQTTPGGDSAPDAR